MRAKAAFAVGLILALGGGQAAQACSMAADSDFNLFADAGFTPGGDIIGRAQSVDWAIIEAPTSERCVSDEQLRPADRAFWRFVPRIAWVNRLLAHLPGKLATGTCNGKPVYGLIAPLRARVVERISGGGPKVYPLWKEVNPDAVEWNAFKDDRTFEEQPGARGADSYTVRALIRHRGNAFLDHGRLSTEEEPGWMCGGPPAAHVGQRYLIFRDSRGSILSATRVLFADDVLLVRLRRYAKRPDLYAHPTLPVEDFVRASDGAAIVRITRCETGRWGKTSDGIVETGDPSATWTGSKPWASKYGMSELRWLGMQLARTNQSCERGDRVFVLKRPFDEDKLWLGYPRAAVIRNGKIRSQDFLTGFRLTGPAEVSVDQAFAWVDEGKASRGATQ